MVSQNKKMRKIVEPAVIAATYVALTFFSASFGLAYAGIQIRLSEALTILPVFTPFAIPGLTIGCFIANIASPFGVADLIFGTLSTLVSAILTRALRKVKFKGMPILSFLPPVLMGAVCIGAIISVASPGGFETSMFISMAMLVGAGQVVSCCGLGAVLYMLLKKTDVFKHQRSTL